MVQKRMKSKFITIMRLICQPSKALDVQLLLSNSQVAAIGKMKEENALLLPKFTISLMLGLNIRKKKIEYKTLLTKFQPKDVKSAATDHGNKFEPFARKKFIEVTGWEVFDIGLVCKDKFSFFGGSPDGLIRLPNGEYGILEIKCSFKYKDDEKIGKIKYLDDQGHLREKHTYYRFFFVRSTNFFTY